MKHTYKTNGTCSTQIDFEIDNNKSLLEQNLRKCGYDSFLCCTGYDTDQKEKYLKLLLSKRVAASTSSALALSESGLV